MRVFLSCFKKEISSSHFKLSIRCEKSRFFEEKELANLIFERCPGCQSQMAAIPQGAFAACKIRSNMDKAFSWDNEVMVVKAAENKKNFSQNYYNQTVLENPMKYSSKLMNSIWGLYNRYSVHNFKKNTDANNFFFGDSTLKDAVSSIPVCSSTFAAGQNL